VPHAFDYASANDIFTWSVTFLAAHAQDDRLARATLARMMQVPGGGDDRVLIDYTAPAALAPGERDVIEFYNASLDHYFLSTNPVEIDNLDSGRTVGWVRTGLRFLVHTAADAGTSPVCRFYRAPAFGDSHFYSGSPAECAQTAAAHPVDWVYESPSVFYVQLPNPTSGACAAGTVAVYRFFNTVTTNHRYTTEQVIRDQMRTSPLWTAEGYGPGPYYPIMCAETS
jgi:hypothetical protein